jgi:hypothetical protein
LPIDGATCNEILIFTMSVGGCEADLSSFSDDNAAQGILLKYFCPITCNICSPETGTISSTISSSETTKITTTAETGIEIKKIILFYVIGRKKIKLRNFDCKAQ